MWLQAITLGLAFSFLGIGVFITLRILNFPDITADGSLTLGASISAWMITNQFSPVFVVAVSVLGGCVAGMMTGFIHTRLKVNGLLSGILVMTALYSVNLRILGRSNVPLINENSVLKQFAGIISIPSNRDSDLIFFFIVVIIFIFIFHFIFKTDFGLALRATGDNETMITAQGVNPNQMKIFGIAISNGMIALSGSLVAQYQGFADIGMGIGIIIFGLASVIIGETMTSSLSQNKIFWRLIGVVVGTILFRLLVALALKIGFNPNDLKLITAVLVLFAIILPRTRKYFGFIK